MAKTVFRDLELEKFAYRDDPEWLELVEQRKWALLLGVTITLDEWDNMSEFEKQAWMRAHQVLNREELGN